MKYLMRKLESRIQIPVSFIILAKEKIMKYLMRKTKSRIQIPVSFIILALVLCGCLSIELSNVDFSVDIINIHINNKE